MRPNAPFTPWLLCAFAVSVAAPSGRAIDIQFDFTYDTNSFFVGHADRQATLNAAAQVFEARLADNLTAIMPAGSNTWDATFKHPGTGAEHLVANPTIQAGVVRVYAGGRNFPGSTLGEGGPGGFNAEGDAEFTESLSRGQSGAQDFGPWGGSISFDSPASWYFDQNVATVESFGTMSDFYSVAVHELAHLLGFGTAPSWYTYVDVMGAVFTGPASLTIHGGPVPLHGDEAHWASGISGDVTSPVMINDQETAMDPTILNGTRKYFTELDFAGMDDVGWQVVPEPGSAILLGGGVMLIASARRRSLPALPR